VIAKNLEASFEILPSICLSVLRKIMRNLPL